MHGRGDPRYKKSDFEAVYVRLHVQSLFKAPYSAYLVILCRLLTVGIQSGASGSVAD